MCYYVFVIFKKDNFKYFFMKNTYQRKGSLYVRF